MNADELGKKLKESGAPLLVTACVLSIEHDAELEAMEDQERAQVRYRVATAEDMIDVARQQLGGEFEMNDSEFMRALLLRLLAMHDVRLRDDAEYKRRYELALPIVNQGLNGSEETYLRSAAFHDPSVR
jgi:hypothetical protein